MAIQIFPEHTEGTRKVRPWDILGFKEGDEKQPSGTTIITTEFVVRREIRTRVLPGMPEDAPENILAQVDAEQPGIERRRAVIITGAMGTVEASLREGDGPHYVFLGTLKEVTSKVDQVLREAGVTLE